MRVGKKTTKKEVSPVVASAYCLESFQAMALGGRIRVDELNKQLRIPGPRQLNLKGICCMERKLGRLQKGPASRQQKTAQRCMWGIYHLTHPEGSQGERLLLTQGCRWCLFSPTRLEKVIMCGMLRRVLRKACLHAEGLYYYNKPYAEHRSRPT